jgi:hypothetical protein
MFEATTSEGLCARTTQDDHRGLGLASGLSAADRQDRAIQISPLVTVEIHRRNLDGEGGGGLEAWRQGEDVGQALDLGQAVDVSFAPSDATAPSDARDEVAGGGLDGHAGAVDRSPVFAHHHHRELAVVADEADRPHVDRAILGREVAGRVVDGEAGDVRLDLAGRGDSNREGRARRDRAQAEGAEVVGVGLPFDAAADQLYGGAHQGAIRRRVPDLTGYITSWFCRSDDRDVVGLVDPVGDPVAVGVGPFVARTGGQKEQGNGQRGPPGKCHRGAYFCSSPALSTALLAPTAGLY